jgi:hypothetical protein
MNARTYEQRLTRQCHVQGSGAPILSRFTAQLEGLLFSSGPQEIPHNLQKVLFVLRIIITELLILARESIGVEVRHQFLHASPEALVFLEHVQGVGPSAIDAIGWYTGKFAQLLEPLHYDLGFAEYAVLFFELSLD